MRPFLSRQSTPLLVIMKLRLAAPITLWDEALPLGNGLQGALFWGEANKLRFSLDRGDLWDERPA
ncbi:MAG: glycoside hydrolase N-terminal domain-containing protein, partial [Opitutaceae bacterium]|nr:glycoside hydrolase N-terminal domain-containing protein [Opitutaceae bacterium]